MRYIDDAISFVRQGNNMEYSDSKNRFIKIVLYVGITAILLYSGRIAFGVRELTKLKHFSRITALSQLEFSGTLNAYALPLLCDDSSTTYDRKGVIVVDYSKSTLQGLHSIEYNPGTIAQFSLCFYNQYKSTGLEDYRRRFLVQLDWLMTHYVNDPEHNYVVWQYDFTVPQHGVNHTGWVSGLTQGVAISALLRGYQMTGQDVYLAVAQKALNSMVIPLDRGGVAYQEDDNLFFEEVPSGNHILNGDIFALLGVYEYWLVTKSDTAQNMVEMNIATLKRWLPRYDLGYWSRYSLDRETIINHWTIASPEYHDLHIDMLQLLYRISGDSYFSDMQVRWENYQNGIPSFLIGASRVVYIDFQLLSKKMKILY